MNFLTVAANFISSKFAYTFYDKQYNRRTFMIFLVITIIGLLGYLVYALINPEKF